MVIILTKCFKWFSFAPNVLNSSHFYNSCFIWSFYVTPFKSVTEHCTGGTICIMLHWGVLRIWYRCGNLGTMHNITTIQGQTNPNSRANTTQKTLNPLTSLMMIICKIEMKSATAIQQWNDKY